MLSRTLRTAAPLRPTRLLHSTAARRNGKDTGHSAESYFKDVDSTPAQDTSLHRVDAGSDAVQRPLDPPSGQYSQAGVKTDEYRNVSKDEPYKQEGEEGTKTKYGSGPTKNE